MDRYKSLLNTFHNTHQVLVQELDTVIEDFTDPAKAMTRRKKLDIEAKHPKPVFSGEVFEEMEFNDPHSKVYAYYPVEHQQPVDPWTKYEEG